MSKDINCNGIRNDNNRNDDDFDNEDNDRLINNENSKRNDAPLIACQALMA